MKKKLLPMQKAILYFFVVELIIALCSAIFIYYSISNNYLINFDHRTLKHFSKSIATIAEIGFLLAIALFILRFIIKNLNQKGISTLNKGLNKIHIDIVNEAQSKFLKSNTLSSVRKFLLIISKFFQRFHIIIALIALSLIIIHAYIFLQFLFFNYFIQII